MQGLGYEDWSCDQPRGHQVTEPGAKKPEENHLCSCMSLSHVHVDVYECTCVQVCSHECVPTCGEARRQPWVLPWLFRCHPPCCLKQGLSLSQDSPGCPDWLSIPRAASVSSGLGLQACATTPGFSSDLVQTQVLMCPQCV